LAWIGVSLAGEQCLEQEERKLEAEGVEWVVERLGMKRELGQEDRLLLLVLGFYFPIFSQLLASRWHSSALDSAFPHERYLPPPLAAF
jgi:hypothetical protein